MTNRQTDPERSDVPELPLDDILAAADALLAEESDFVPPSSVQREQPAPLAAPAPTTAAAPAPTTAAAPAPHAAAPAQESVPTQLPGEGPELPPLRRKKRRTPRVLLCIALILCLLVSLLAVAADRWFHYHIARGRTQVLADYDNVVIALPTEDKRVVASDDGKTVQYQGHSYRLNENVATVLFMGIDRKDIDETEIGQGGQADSILLIAVDTVTGKTSIVNISRDSYAEMMLYSSGGQEAGYAMQQLCLAYAYGDGRETSCQNMIATVSNLLYDMPIQKYIALDMDGVLAANEAVGGITLVSLSDIKMPDGSYVSKGDEITLHGHNCERYIRTRSQEMDANEERMARQKQYVETFASKLTKLARSDLNVISNLYDTVEPYMVTNMDLSDVLFLVQIYLDNGMDFDFLSISGTYDWLETNGKQHSVYYLDNDNLFETTLAIYYTQVD